MQGYKDAPDTTFVGSEAREGYRKILASYLRHYAAPGQMAQLTFSGLEIRRLPDAQDQARYAVVTGSFDLERTTRGQAKKDDGVLSLLWEHTVSGWKIIVDHTNGPHVGPFSEGRRRRPCFAILFRFMPEKHLQARQRVRLIEPDLGVLGIEPQQYGLGVLLAVEPGGNKRVPEMIDIRAFRIHRQVAMGTGEQIVPFGAELGHGTSDLVQIVDHRIGGTKSQIGPDSFSTSAAIFLRPTMSTEGWGKRSS